MGSTAQPPWTFNVEYLSLVLQSYTRRPIHPSELLLTKTITRATPDIIKRVWRATYLGHTSDYTLNFCQEIVSLARNDTQPTKESSFPPSTCPTAYINRKYDKHLNPPSCGTEQLNRARLLLKIQDISQDNSLTSPNDQIKPIHTH